jgi:hypothetical protein
VVSYFEGRTEVACVWKQVLRNIFRLEKDEISEKFKCHITRSIEIYALHVIFSG